MRAPLSLYHLCHGDRAYSFRGHCSAICVELVRKAVGAGRRAYVLVNNRSEGNAPLTVQAIAEILDGGRGSD